ncbi:cobyrinate a,c-diamide synthase [Aliikangiella sp. IMCC44359]|uniref:cobyrinate a,c-diamide synthase n=1 Tax=Aliikangiella sp. IMCC44359 TaxID=3459125 RepID=UPI00403AF66F
MSVTCPALFIAAPASGQGKTTITAALARMLVRQGKRVQVFKCGPDYLDPQILSQASKQGVEQLDLWMAGEDYCQQMLFDAALQSDLILIEGVMGMFDGEPSSADLAARFNIPMIIIMDVKGMAQTASAIATGLANFRDDINVVGLIANNCGSERHAQLIRDSLPTSLPLLASLERTPMVALPERHLGLVQAEEIIEELESRFNAGADWLERAGLEEMIKQPLLSPVEFYPVEKLKNNIIQPSLKNKTIAIARDKAFSFIYDANLRLLKQLGAQYVFFSPLNDPHLPSADALWLPGGYPELHAEKLSTNHSMKLSIQQFHQSKKPVLAECGGYLYTLETLTDLDNKQHSMLGLIQGEGAMRGKRGCQGMQTAALPEGNIRGHAHHRSRSVNTPEPIAYGIRQRHSAPGEAIYREGTLTATYLHLFFPSNPAAIAQLLCPSKEVSNASAEIGITKAKNIEEGHYVS